MPKISQRAMPLKQSGIRAASVKCSQLGGINLGQGVCDLPIRDEIKQATYSAIEQDKSLYSACEGVHPLREALAQKIADYNGVNVNPDNELIVSHGSTGAFISAVATVFNPGDEVILFEPFYGYHKNILNLYDVSVKSVSINLDDLSIDLDELAQAIGPNTRGIIVCTPNNPTGKVYTRDELTAIGRLAKQHDLVVITDEIYEYITYPGHQHISLASLEDFKDNTITISGFSKTYNMTGWRMGYASGPSEILTKMALVQDLIYVCPATPLQHGVLSALQLHESYYQDMAEMFLHLRDYTVSTLNEMGIKSTMPQGAYYLMADVSALGLGDAQQTADTLLNEAKVASVPGGAFYNDPSKGQNIVRFCYAQKQEVVEKALQQLQDFI